ncbi:MAG: hypothetical protein NT121_12040 [Chloroflexi bacterium]|nr:hypothetical protein [Chloroflexota bacterium]
MDTKRAVFIKNLGVLMLFSPALAAQAQVWLLGPPKYRGVAMKSRGKMKSPVNNNNPSSSNPSALAEKINFLTAKSFSLPGI